MADIVVQVTLGDEEFRLDRVTVREVDRVTSLTSYTNKREWFAGIQREEPKATIAAYVIAKARKGETVRWDDVDFPDDVNARFVDDSGREVEPLFEENDDGTLRTDDRGNLLPVLRGGVAVWVYADTRDEVPPTSPEVTAVTSATPEMRGNSSESVSGIPTTVPS